jgi:hypothetical protein
MQKYDLPHRKKAKYTLVSVSRSVRKLKHNEKTKANAKGVSKEKTKAGGTSKEKTVRTAANDLNFVTKIKETKKIKAKAADEWQNPLCKRMRQTTISF